MPIIGFFDVSFYFTYDDGVPNVRENEEYYPLTHPQLGIWYTEKMYPGTSIGIVAGTLKLKGYIDYSLLEKAIYLYIDNNDTLRLHFVEIDGKPKQYYSQNIPSKIQTYDFTSSSKDSIYEWDTIRTQLAVNLIDCDLYEIDILKVSETEAGIYIKMHHLISDGWSIINTVNDIYKIYSELISKNQDFCYRMPPSYSNFIKSEYEYEKSEKFLKDAEYWKKVYKHAPEFTTLKNRKNNIICSEAKRKSFVLPSRFNKKIGEYCRENRSSIFILFFAALSLYLNRVTDKDDIVIGVPVLNRSTLREKSMMGMFINTLPVRINVDNCFSFFEFQSAIAKEWMSSLKHHKYSCDMIIKNVRENFKGINDLYDIVLSYQNAKINKYSDSNIEGRWHFCGHQKQSLNIHINERENDGTIIIDYDFLVDTFNAKEIDFIHDHITRILWHALDNPGKCISRLDMISEKEKGKILNEFNSTSVDYPSEKSIIQLFESQVEMNHDKCAALFNGKTLTYNEFNNKVNKLAWRLIEAGVEPGDVIAVYISRGINALTSIYSILKCGAVFLPIDPSYPEERIRYIINDSAPKIILYADDTLSRKFKTEHECINVTDLIINKFNNPQIYTKGNSIAYIIYTSGSSGKPKGAMITNKGLVNYVLWAVKSYVKGDDVTFPLHSSLSFDLTMTSIFTPLISGNSVMIYDDNDVELPILKVFEDKCVEIVKLTPAHLNLIKEFDNSKSSIKKLIVGGEELKTDLARQVYTSFNGNIEIYNEYGPTETVVGCTLYKYDFERDKKVSVPIGKPADNVRIYILDKYLNPVPIGMPGEMYIGGDGVCAGYINNPRLTNEKFISDPFLINKKVYRTGDLARWFPQGDIEFLGRIDNQIKINGYRIEIGEIESQLLNNDHISEAVVVDMNHTDGRKYLCAYIVGDKKITLNDIRDYLVKNIPSFMIPSFFIFLDKIPLTSNGKVDKVSLPRPDMNDISDDYNAPTNEYEKTIAEIFQNVLGIERVSITDSFINLGVDSLTIIKIQAMLLKYDWKVSTQDFYEHPTIKLLSKKLVDTNSNHFEFSYGLQKFEPMYYSELVSAGSILLTGATGFLGAHLLNYIVKNSNYEIYCLVREDNREKACKKLLDILKFYFKEDYSKFINNRVYIVKGDFTEKKLGLSNNEYYSLGGKTKRIIHSGALVKHYGDIELFKQTNINGTKHLIDFALQFDIQFNYISTMSIAGSYSEKVKSNTEFYENDLYIGQKIDDNIYVKTKYLAEEIVLDNVQKKGLKANIFRIGNLCGRYNDGVFQKNIGDNLFYNRVSSIIYFGFISKSILDVEVDLTPVDYCSEAIIKIIEGYRDRSDIYHIFNSNKLRFCSMVNLLNCIGKSIEIIDSDLFYHRVKRLYEQNDQARMLSGFINEINSKFSFGNLLIVNAEKTINLLKKIGFVWPECNEVYINKLYGNIERDNTLYDEGVI